MVYGNLVKCTFMGHKYQVLLYYKYVGIEDPGEVARVQRELCERLGLKGRIIVANEGINGTVEGLTKDAERYIEEMQKDRRFQDVWFKKSEGFGDAFPRLSIKVRPEIVATHIPNIDPTRETGKYLSVEELHEWIHSGRQFYIVDMRNDYEQRSGYFKDSILSNIANFWELPKMLDQIADLKDQTIVTVCTGGVRCEKGSAFLLQSGFKDIYQLHGGIVSYMEKYPNEDFLGKLYVFDNRLVMGFNSEDSKHQIVGKCDQCGRSCDSYVNCGFNFCHRHYISCSECVGERGIPFCNKACESNFDAQNERPRAYA